MTALPERRIRADLRLAIPAVTSWAVVAVGIALPASLGALTCGAWLITALSLGGLVLQSRCDRAVFLRRGAVVLAMLTLSSCASAVLLTSATAQADGRRPPPLLEAARAGRFVVATATTTQTRFATSRSITAVVDSIRIGAEQYAVSVPVRVFSELAAAPVSGLPPTAARTDSAQSVSATVSPAPTPGSSTGAAHSSTLGIGTVISLAGRFKATAPADSTAFLVFASSAPKIIRPPPPLLDWANVLRHSFRAAAARLPGNGGDLLPGLAIGDTSAVSGTLDQSMKATSLSHLTAVSGANCAVVVGLVMLGGAVVGLRRGARVAVAVAALVGFVVLVTPEPSVLRAAVMATAVLLCLATGRPSQGIPVLSLAVLTLLGLDPWLSREYGFILSVLATAGLLVLSGPLAMALTRWLPKPIAVILSVPLAAQLACQPVIILLNPAIPSYGLLANILAGPAAPVATVLGLAACVVLPLWPWLGGVLAFLAWVPAAWIAAVATVVSQLPGGQLPWLAGIGGLTLLAILTILLLTLLLAPGLALRWRRAIAMILAVLLVGHGAFVAGGSLRTVLTRPAGWQFALCDIGQGDAVLVQSGGKIALIDTGPLPERLTHCLDALGIEHIDLLILTHYDLDHVGGVTAVVGRVGEAINGPSSGADDDRTTRLVRSGGANVRLGVPGLSGRLGDLRWRILWPPNPLRGVEPGNPASIIVVFDGVGACQSGCLSAVFLGDLGEESQARLLSLGTVGEVDVVKVAHHGSADQSARLYSRLRARVGLIGVGADNNYGHPNPKLLHMLATSSTIVARSDRDGLVLVTPAEGGAITLWRERGEARP